MEPVVRGSVRTIFGEDPLWDHEKGCLYMVDLAEKKVLEYHPTTEETISYQLPELVTSLIKYSKEELIVLMKDGFYLLHLQNGTLHPIVKPEGLNERLLLNDAKCDPQGRIWTGSVDDHFKEFKESANALTMKFTDQKGFIYRVDKTLAVHQVKDKVIVSNGLDFDPERNLMYHVDSATQAIVQFDIDPKTGEISNEETVYEFEEIDGFPDGMTIDREGMLWVALFKPGPLADVTPKHGIIAKIDPFQKKWIDSIVVPTSHVTSCVFGGEDLKTLFITTALEPIAESKRSQQPNAGCLFSVELEIGGYQANPFLGNIDEKIRSASVSF